MVAEKLEGLEEQMEGPSRRIWKVSKEVRGSLP
jgi:hypothetical protein